MSSTEPTGGVPADTYAGTWTLDPASTTVAFHTKAMWVFNVKGSMRASAGSGTVGEDGSVTGSLTFDVASISTGNKKRDDHLRSADFLETDKYPTMTFEATGATRPAEGRATITGTLTVRDQSRPVSVDVEAEGGPDAVTLHARIDDLDRSQWGIDWAKMGAGLHNRVEIDARFTRA